MNRLFYVMLWLALPVAVCVWAVAHGQQVRGDPSLAIQLSPDARPTRPNVPGAVLTDDVRKICRRGYSASVRPPEWVSERYKLTLLRQLPAGISHDPWDWKLDDKVPLEIGGKPGNQNYWLQPRAEAQAKDIEENRIHHEVCAGRIDIHDAQKYFLSWPDGTLQ